ncbi:hypothetical protein DQ04_21701000 [Trypanosoma grayi]|uniref:hypothetical protein n=1 Tax=Trypanosoma grayi TaxID=71804 RepID=UPI0004F48C77|nr:hypothetical protein DQ04_21701000 [Trypanosoma grayi]KEG05464.1 hypothetical protein DQ04_21701000 [Trypanosoma grayi]
MYRFSFTTSASKSTVMLRLSCTMARTASFGLGYHASASTFAMLLNIPHGRSAIATGALDDGSDNDDGAAAWLSAAARLGRLAGVTSTMWTAFVLPIASML